VREGYRQLRKMLATGGAGQPVRARRAGAVSDTESLEIGLVTRTLRTPDEPDRLELFLPGFPNPLSGHLVIVPASAPNAQSAGHDALRACSRSARRTFPPCGNTPAV